MAIAFDNAGDGGGSGSTTSFVYSYTVGSGSNRKLFVGGDTNGTITGITYAGVAMTQVEFSPPSTNISPVYLWYLDNPTSGANNVVVSLSSSSGINGVAVSYSGCAAGMPEVHSSGAQSTNSTSITESVTTSTDNDWVVMVTSNAGGSSAGTGDVQRVVSSGTGQQFYDSNGPVTPPGSYSMTVHVNNNNWTWAIAGFAPAAGGGGTLSISVSDSESEAESVTIEEIDFISVSDSESEAELVNIERAYCINVSDSESENESVTFLETSFISVNDGESESESVSLYEIDFISVNDTESESDVVVNMFLYVPGSVLILTDYIAQLQTFNYTGSVVSWTCPQSVTSVFITLYGAQGGAGSAGGGLGGQVTGRYAVTSGLTYYINVGGQGSTGTANPPANGGYGGGASGGNGGTAGNGGGGGGMSWFSTQNTFDTTHVVLVAAGGGGGGSNGTHGSGSGTGGGGGATTGVAGQNGSTVPGYTPIGGGGGTPSGGGAGGTSGGVTGTAGVGGIGGDGANQPNNGGGGGGGGGGYYGGGGGGGGGNNGGTFGGVGAGGGSSYAISGVTEFNTTAAVNSGNGSVTIEYGIVVDTETESESVSMTIKTLINVFDTETEGELVMMIIRSHTMTETAATIGVSSYKWLNQNLFNTQNQFTVRPALNAFVADETLLVNQQLENSTAWSGDSVQAPDGSILAIGRDINGNLSFYRVTDGTQVSQWNNVVNGTGTVIAYNSSSGSSPKWEYQNKNFGSGSNNGFHINASISVSDWIQGAYVIDVYFWYNNSGASLFEIQHARSVNLGTTWTIETFSSGTSAVQNTTLNPFCLAAGKPIYIPSTGNVSAQVFYSYQPGPYTSIGQNQGVFYYNYSSTGSFSGSSTGWVSWIPSASTQVSWADSSDWSIHSFDVDYANGTYYIIFSGYHQILENTNSANAPTLSSSPASTQNQFFGNYGLYLMRLMQPSDVGTGAQTGTSVIWDEPREVLSFNSNSPQNFNQCLYPGLNYDGTYLWLTFRGDFTNSISEANVVVTQTNYYLSKTANFENFDYPTIVLDSNGNTPNQYTNNGLAKYSFIGNQNGYYYFWGDGALWQFVQNDIIADVSNDIVSFSIQDQSGGTSSINLTINNANGKWFGPSPTGANFSAICKNGFANKNSKIYLRMGYYDSNGADVIPRNIFYIDDITNNINATTNDLVITGRDFNKLLSITQTRWTYTFQGQDLYYDSFTTQTIAGWNTSQGSWQSFQQTGMSSSNVPISLNVFSPYSTFQSIISGTTITYTDVLNTSTLATLSGYTIKRPQMSMSVVVYLPASGTGGNPEVDIYPFYINLNNYIQIQLIALGGTTNLSIVQMKNGSSTTLSGPTSLGSLSAGYYTVYVSSYNYFNNIDVMIGGIQTQNFGNDIFQFTNTLGSATVSPSAPYQNAYGQLPTIGIGTNGSFGSDSGVSSPTIWASFSNLRFVNYTYSQDIEELTKRLGTKAHIFNFVLEKDYVQDLYDITQWYSSGTFSVKNRRINLSYNSFALQNTQQYTDGRISFDAQVSTSSTSNFGFDFIFRSSSQVGIGACYKLRFMNSQNYTSGNQLVKASLLISENTIGSNYQDKILSSSIMPDNLQSATYGGSNNLEIDLTQLNHFDIIFNKGWIYAFINKIMVFAWYDNNYYITYSTGYWGFSTVNSGAGSDYAFSSNEVVYIENIEFPTFWQFVPTFTLNPGDDLTSAITQNLQTVFGWVFSDLGGRCKIVTLKTTDGVSYYYGNGAQNYLLYNMSNDSSDKEYFNQILVVGDGVSYLASNNSNIGSNGILRVEVVVDYTITTVADAQTRATQELNNITKYGIQPAPTQIINVGSEVFDVVNVQDNNGANTSNLNGNYRVYTETFNADNQSNFNIALGTGQITG